MHKQKVPGLVADLSMEGWEKTLGETLEKPLQDKNRVRCANDMTLSKAASYVQWECMNFLLNRSKGVREKFGNLGTC